MTRKRFSEEQIIGVLREHEAGAKASDLSLSSSVKCNTTARYRARYDLLRSMFNMTTWFCDAYASWQKSGIENANGRLRRWLPRNLDIDALDEQELQDVVFTANLTPRTCLGYKTPFQAMLADLGKDVKITFA